MKCPICRTSIRFVPDGKSQIYPTEYRAKVGFRIEWGKCPECEAFLISRSEGRYWEQDDLSPPTEFIGEREQRFVYPSEPARQVEASEVPERYRIEFNEAAALVSLSPKASAAMSRRILQDLMREVFSIKKGRLPEELSRFSETGGAPTYILEAIDAVRVIGNLAAHPEKDKATGQIVDVEPGEAEWLLEVLEALYDFAFVQPRRLAARKSKLNKKLESMGKQPLKANHSKSGGAK